MFQRHFCKEFLNRDAYGSNCPQMLCVSWVVNPMCACSSTSPSMDNWMRREDGFWRPRADSLVWVFEYTLLILVPSCSTSKTFLKVVNIQHHLMNYLDLMDYVLWFVFMWMICWVVAQ